MSSATNEAPGEAKAEAAPEAPCSPKGRLPLPVALVWMCAFVGLGTYVVALYLPGLALGGSP